MGKLFEQGNPGRPEGARGKFTLLRDAFLKAFDELGGVDGIVKWAKKNGKNRGHFYQMIARMLPIRTESDLFVEQNNKDYSPANPYEKDGVTQAEFDELVGEFADKLAEKLLAKRKD